MKAPIHRMCTKKNIHPWKNRLCAAFLGSSDSWRVFYGPLQSADAPRASCTFDRQVDWAERPHRWLYRLIRTRPLSTHVTARQEAGLAKPKL